MIECRYLIMRNGQILVMTENGINQRGFTKEELSKEQKTADIIIDMVEDLRIDLDTKNDDCMLYLLWLEKYQTPPIMNVNDFSIPQIVESNDDYLKKVSSILMHYKATIHESISTKYETILLKDVDFVCDTLLGTLSLGINSKFSEMDEKMKNLIAYYLDDEFWISELDHSYAFRGLTYFEKLHSQGYGQHYEELKGNDLTFFRAVCQETVPDIKRMLNCPYTSLSKASSERFSKQRASCMYLGTTSYVCAKELQFDEKSDKNLYVSAIKFNNEGKKLKVLNLASSKYWNIYDRRRDGDKQIRKQIWLSHLKLYPVIIATSFVVKNHTDKELKYEYLLSQSLMRTLKINGIDGIAYATKRDSNSDFAFPHNINLALLVDDVSKNNEYGTLKSFISVTQPVMITHTLIETITQSPGLLKNHSYITQHFNDSGFNSMTHWFGDNVFYSKIPYSLFDDYLVNQTFINGNQL